MPVNHPWFTGKTRFRGAATPHFYKYIIFIFFIRLNFENLKVMAQIFSSLYIPPCGQYRESNSPFVHFIQYSFVKQTKRTHCVIIQPQQGFAPWHRYCPTKNLPVPNLLQCRLHSLFAELVVYP